MPTMKVSDEKLEMLRRAITVGIEDWRSGRLDERPVDEILDQIDREKEESSPA